MTIEIDRPDFPEGYVSKPKTLLSWDYIGQRLREARNYWVASVGLDQKPHVVPVWGAWVGDRFYFDGDPKTKHLRNLATNLQVALHLEDGSKVLIVYGICKAVEAANAPVGEIASQYREKYAGMGYAPEANQWDEGGLFVIIPKKVLAWSEFSTDPTRFVLKE